MEQIADALPSAAAAVAAWLAAGSSAHALAALGYRTAPLLQEQLQDVSMHLPQLYELVDCQAHDTSSNADGALAGAAMVWQ
jgi:hypothetical protein